ncbi:MAG: hypothetical protein HQK53_10905 [Oligoflexia bacterium]|nr:hypothetical protein [Oligoflexia bacterium]
MNDEVDKQEDELQEEIAADETANGQVLDDNKVITDEVEVEAKVNARDEVAKEDEIAKEDEAELGVVNDKIVDKVEDSGSFAFEEDVSWGTNSADTDKSLDSLKIDGVVKTPVQMEVDDFIKIEEKKKKESHMVNLDKINTPNEVAKGDAPRGNAPRGDAPTTKMNFAMSGSMELLLTFDVDGQQVSIKVEKGSGLVIELMHGMRFVVPLGK